MKASTSAFAWNGDFKNGPPHVYISLVGNVQPRLLTPENETGVVPAWSPDGQSIAYVGRAKGQDTELRVIPALGGPSRKIASGSFLRYRLLVAGFQMVVVERGRKVDYPLHLRRVGIGGRTAQALRPARQRIGSCWRGRLAGSISRWPPTGILACRGST